MFRLHGDTYDVSSRHKSSSRKEPAMLQRCDWLHGMRIAAGEWIAVELCTNEPNSAAT